MSSFRNPLLLTAATFALLSCKPEVSAPVVEDVAEQRPDGLTYLSGTDQKFTGVYQRRTKTGQVHEEQHYREGFKHGPFFLYYQNGKARRRIDYIWGAIVRERAWFEDGNVRFDIEKYEDEARGFSKYWHPNGTIAKLVTLAPELQKHGQILQFDESGNVIADAIYDNGVYVSGLRPVEKEAAVVPKPAAEPPAPLIP